MPNGSLYTPFARDVVRTVGQGMQQRQVNQLARSAYMGDPQAMAQLQGVAPQIAGSIAQQQRAGRQEQVAGQQRKQQQQMQAQKQQAAQGQRINEILSEASAIEDDEQAIQYALETAQREGIQGLDSAKLTPEVMQRARQVTRPTGADGFKGTGMQAQMFNLVSEAETNPALKNTPEYKLAVAQLSKPQIIQTETGTKQIPGLDIQGILSARQPMVQADQGVQQKVNSAIEAIPIKGAEKKIKYTADENKAFGFAARMDQASRTVDELTAAGFEPSQVSETLASRIPGIGNYMVSSQFQQYEQAKENWVTANLRRESGAVIGQEEMVREIRKYFPVVGDKPDVIAQKKRARQAGQKGMAESSKRSTEEINKIAGIDEVPEETPSLPQGMIDNGDGTFTLPDGRIVRRTGG